MNPRAFTLIEVTVVVIVVGLLAASAIPAMDTLTQTRRISALREIERRLVVARATAITTGQPTGVKIVNAADSIQFVSIVSSGAAPTPVITPTGEPDQPFPLAADFPGVAITNLTAGDGTTADTTIWFSFEGVPQIRSANGTLIGGFTQDAWIQVTGQLRVYVRAASGLIER